MLPFATPPKPKITGIRVPPGFAVTKAAYQVCVVEHGLWGEIERILNGFNPEDIVEVGEAGKVIRQMIQGLPLPAEIEQAMRHAYAMLGERCGDKELPVAVRSSATAEDLAGASFAGQQETYLWMRGADEVVRKTVDCWASLFTDRAISYRAKMGLPSFGLAIAVGVQQMVSTQAAGVMFTVDPISGAIKRAEQPEDLVGLVAFLASEESDFITGQTIVVDGGRQLQ